MVANAATPMTFPFTFTVVRPGRSSGRMGSRGFTLIELIMVIVILGVLAVYAAPRIFNSNDFYARGFHDETLSLLRYAQKVAIAQRRTVCVTFTSTSATLTMAASPSTFDCATATALTGPNGSPTITARSGVTYNTTTPPVSFNFDGLGRPIDGSGVAMATQNIKIDNADDVVVEAATGYVHD
jgi:MSHA pilin protein MshC